MHAPLRLRHRESIGAQDPRYKHTDDLAPCKASAAGAAGQPLLSKSGRGDRLRAGELGTGEVDRRRLNATCRVEQATDRADSYL
jgi:hypothetical protein